jgi:hypothetical protein
LLGSQADAQATLPSIRNRDSTVTAIPHLAAKGYVAWEQSSVTCITNEFERYLDCETATLRILVSKPPSMRRPEHRDRGHSTVPV